MQTLITLIALAAGLVSLICWIIVLTKMFPSEGALRGVLGIICSIYAFIWGWMNADRFNIRNLMLIWTASVLVGLVTNFLFAGFAR